MASASNDERSPAARARAERALTVLLAEVGDSVDLIVLGGLVPPTLTIEKADVTVPAHLGTADVDVLLISHLDTPTAELGRVEVALHGMGFEPSGEEGWRWHGPVGGIQVRIEFLCDLDDYRHGEVVRPRGCIRLAANNLRGTGYVSRDVELRTLTAESLDGDDRVLTVEAKFAGLQGYLLSKCVAARGRGATKDYYDLGYVVLHNWAGGPTEVAALLLSGDLADAVPVLRSTLLELRERYRETTDIGPRSYATEMLKVTPDSDEARLRATVAVGVGQFLDRLLVTAQAGTGRAPTASPGRGSPPTPGA